MRRSVYPFSTPVFSSESPTEMSTSTVSPEKCQYCRIKMGTRMDPKKRVSFTLKLVGSPDMRYCRSRTCWHLLSGCLPPRQFQAIPRAAFCKLGPSTQMSTSEPCRCVPCNMEPKVLSLASAPRHFLTCMLKSAQASRVQALKLGVGMSTATARASGPAPMSSLGSLSSLTASSVMLLATAAPCDAWTASASAQASVPTPSGASAAFALLL
mmetsp:Transcript_78443/g.243620  ORF Transcript_78443/g.243620 Transcript_78443/m.243620 type:complete len:211 (+) Transcript_78443:392-1024(+)